jgi:hypothetical protein
MDPYLDTIISEPQYLAVAPHSRCDLDCDVRCDAGCVSPPIGRPYYSGGSWLFQKVWFGDADQLTREAGFASLGSGESSFFVNSDLRHGNSGLEDMDATRRC